MFTNKLTHTQSAFNVDPVQAINLWGTPTSISEITQIFASHLTSHSPPQLPWSESANLSPETTLIKEELISLTNKKFFWTIASQPAVDGQPSDHKIYGWGPPGGFVFQKAFVEFFIPASTFSKALKPQLQKLNAEGEISWYSVTASGTFESSEPSSAVHAVTWGSFKGKEIATATMVEEVAFRAWGEEAFGIWGEWGRCIGELARGLMPEDTKKARLRACREFLMRMRSETVLINVIGHAYMDKNRLWEVLLDG